MALVAAVTRSTSSAGKTVLWSGPVWAPGMAVVRRVQAEAEGRVVDVEVPAGLFRVLWEPEDFPPVRGLAGS